MSDPYSLPQVSGLITVSMDAGISPSKSPLKYCYHPDCGKPLSIHKGESRSHFENRKHCNERCSSTNPLVHAAQSAEYTRKRLEHTRQCEYCSGNFTRNKFQGTKAFEKQRFCSQKCNKLNQGRENREKIKKETKICENPECKKEFHRRISANSIESAEKFKKRRGCSVTCSAVVRWKPNSLTRKSSGGGKKPKPAVRVCPLPSVEPLKREIPAAPQPVEKEVWRPASWGGPIKVTTNS